MTDDLGGNILLLSGHPGSGKSTIAEALANLPGVPKVHFHSDDLWGYIKHGRIDPWLPQSHQQNRMIMQIAADVAGRYAKEGYFVILGVTTGLAAGLYGTCPAAALHCAAHDSG
nr:AAA family ATPase [Agrobacterium fabrum]